MTNRFGDKTFDELFGDVATPSAVIHGHAGPTGITTYYSATNFPGAVTEETHLRPLSASMFDALLQGMQQSLITAEHATQSIDALAECAKALTAAVRELAGSVHRFSVPVNALSRVDLRLRSGPLLVSVEQDDEETFVAEIIEVGAVGYGETVGDAVDAVVGSLCEIYDEIVDAEPETLGPQPLRWQAALKQLIERVDG